MWYVSTVLYVQEVVTHFLYSKLIYKMGHYFLGRQNVHFQIKQKMHKHIRLLGQPTKCPKIYRKSVLHLRICGNIWNAQYEISAKIQIFVNISLNMTS